MATEKNEFEGKKVSENIYLCPDGKYRWVYELSMLKNPIILITVWKVLGVSCLICLLLVGIPILITDGPEGLAGIGKGFAMAAAILIPLSVIAYLILTKTYGWKYMVLFEMDDKSVRHIQMKQQFKKAEAFGWLTAMAGLAAGSLSAAGAGLLTATRDTQTSDFASVRKVRVNRPMHTIHVNQLLSRNQVYADGKDFDFVLEYILARVPGSAGGTGKSQ